MIHYHAVEVILILNGKRRSQYSLDLMEVYIGLDGCLHTLIMAMDTSKC